MLDIWDIILVCILGFLAGFIDAIAGGGGLIQLPALLSFFPSLPVASAIGINKFAGFLGTSTAAIRYIKQTKINWKFILPGIIAAFIFSLLGAMLIAFFDKEIMKPIVLILLVIVFIYTLIVKTLGVSEGKSVKKPELFYYSALTGILIGFYDGFFGPGTGSFLIMIYIIIFGFNFLNASAYSKIINVVTNLSALIFFLIKGLIVFQIAIPMASCNMLGSWIGAKTAIKRGSSFVRQVYIIIVLLLILKMSYEMFLK